MAIGGRFTAVAARQLLLDQVARRPGLLQRVEPRVKLIGMLGLIVSVSFLHRLDVVAGAFLLALILLWLSHVRVTEISGLWAAVFVLSLLFGGGSVLNLVAPGRHVLDILPPGRYLGWQSPDGLAVTLPGLGIFARLSLRIITNATLAYLLYATTGPAPLLGALGSLGVPNLFIVVLLMTHRYLFVLARSAEETRLAMTSRLLSPADRSSARKLTVSAIGSLFSRSRRLANDVHHAMVSRAFVGEIRMLRGRRPGLSDFAWLAGCAAVCAALVVFGR